MADLQTTDMAPILHSLGDKKGFTVLLKFTKLGFFIPIQGTSAIMDQITCTVLGDIKIRHIIMILNAI